jgi:hypothetical protein
MINPLGPEGLPRFVLLKQGPQRLALPLNNQASAYWPQHNKALTVDNLADNLRQAPPLATPLRPEGLRHLMQDIDHISQSVAHLAHFHERREGWLATLMPTLSVN